MSKSNKGRSRRTADDDADEAPPARCSQTTATVSSEDAKASQDLNNEPEATGATQRSVSTGSSSEPKKKKKSKEKKKSTKTKASSSAPDRDLSSSHAESQSSLGGEELALLAVTAAEAMRTTPPLSPKPPKSTSNSGAAATGMTKVGAQRATVPRPEHGQRLPVPGEPEAPATTASATTSARTKVPLVNAGAHGATTSGGYSPSSQTETINRADYQAKAQAAAAAVRAAQNSINGIGQVNAASTSPAPFHDEEYDACAEPEQSQSFRPTPGAYAMDQPAPIWVPDDEDEDEEPIPEELIPQPPQRYVPAPMPPPDDFGGGGGDINGEPVLDAQVQLAVPFEKDDDFDEPSWFSGKRLWIMVGGAVVVIILIVVIVVVAAAGGGGGDPVSTDPPTVDTTRAPTSSPTEAGTIGCFDSTTSIWNTLLRGRAAREEFDTFLDIELCERTEIRVDIVNRELPWVGVWPPLAAVSNVRFKCGPDGDLTGQCVVAFGDTLVLNNNWAANEVAARNVTFEGITFQRGINSFMELINGGDITFKNCGFRQSFDKTPIIIDYRDEWGDPSIRQTVTFDSCIFEEMQFGTVQIPYAQNYMDFSTLILATHSSNTVVVKDCIFRPKQTVRNTNSDPTVPGYIITSLGAEVIIENSCFSDTSFGIGGSPVLLGLEETNDPIFSATNNFISESGTCAFVSQVEPGAQPTCRDVSADATECQAGANELFFSR